MSLDLLFPHFDELVRTPEDVQRLNEAILQLAVQGKLVAQDPNDEPVKDLLYGIGMWIDETGLSNRVPFSVPHTWQWLRLGELRPEFQNGCSRRTSASTGIESVVIRLADIVHGAIALNNTRSIGLLPDERRKYHLKSGDILITRVNGSVDLIGGFTLVQEEVDLCYCDHFIRMRIDNQILHPAYLALVGKSALIRGQIREKFITTAGQKTVNQTHISTLWLPLAPLAEQLRIVTKVDEIFAQTRALEANLRQAQEDVVTVNRAALHRLHTAQDDDQFQVSWHTIRDHFDVLYDDPRNVSELRQTILDLAVRGKLVPQDPSDEPAGELLKRIEAERGRLVKERLISAEDAGEIRLDSTLHVPIAILGEVRSGIQKSNIREPNDNPRRYITVAHVQRNRIDLNDPRYFEVSDDELEKWRLVSGDVLVIEGNGSAEHIGRAAVFLGEIENCVHQNHVIRVRPNRAFILPQYLNLYLNSPPGRNQITERSRTTSGLYNLSVGRIKTIAVPLSNLSRQVRIVAKVDQLMRLCDALESQLAQAEVVRSNCISAGINVPPLKSE